MAELRPNYYNQHLIKMFSRIIIPKNDLQKGMIISNLYKNINGEKKNYNDKLATQAGKLHQRQTQMKAVKLINKKIGSLVGELKKLQGGKVLETVKKSHANKYNKAKVFKDRKKASKKIRGSKHKSQD